MIISHEHRFVFLHVPKTAGSSVDAYLSTIAGPDAVCTPLNPPVAGHVPRNYERWFDPVPEMLATRKIRPALRDLRNRRAFYNHIDALRVRSRLGRRRWDSYFKFCFERNPWDKTVSWYFFQRSKGKLPMSFEDYVLTGSLPSNFGQYSIAGSVAVDFVGRYEHLTEDLTLALGEAGVTGDIHLERAKSDTRPAGTDAASQYTAAMDARVEREFAREIAYFGFTRPAPPK